MQNKLLLLYIIIITVKITRAASNISITPAGQVSVTIDQSLNLTCTAKLKDAQGRSLELLSFGQEGIVWPQYFLVLSSNQDYLVDDGNQLTINSYYNKSSTDMMIGLHIQSVIKNHTGIYKCAASYLSSTIQDEVTVKVNVLGIFCWYRVKSKSYIYKHRKYTIDTEYFTF